MRGGSPAKKILTQMAEKRHFQVMIFGLFRAPEVPPATCCFRRRNKMLPMLSRRAAACLHTASATCLCCVLLPCILRPLGSVSKLTSCASSCRRSSGCSRYVLRRRRRIYFCMLRSSMLSCVDRRGAAAYGDAYLLFGKPKMLISASPFAPFFVVS